MRDPWCGNHPPSYPAAKVRRVLAWGSKLLMLHGTPHGIGLGFALGLTLSLLPIPVVGMIAALALAPLVRANPAATYLGTAVVNPFTAPALYFAELWLGTTALGRAMPSWSELTVLDAWGWWALFRDSLAPFGLGAGLMMLAAMSIAYPGVRLAVSRWGAADAHAQAPSGTSGSD